MNTIPHHALDDNLTVYRLKDPRDNTIHYIGITINVYERFKQHLRCDGCNPGKDEWIQELQLAQQMVIMESIEQVGPLSYALERETYWIQYYLQQGAELFNIAGVRLASPVKPKKAIAPKVIRNIRIHVDSWILCDYPIGKRNNRFVTVEYATNEEFQSWLEWNQVDDSILEEVRVPSTATWKFDHRVLIINHALDQGMSLELADGRIIRLAQEGA